MKFKDLKEGQDYWIRLYNVKKVDKTRFTTAGNSFGDNYYFKSEETVTALSTEDYMLVEKDKIPPYVADWVIRCKMRGGLAEAVNPVDFCTNKKVVDWYEEVESEFAEGILAKAYIFGYEVEEPLGVLLVDMPGYSSWEYVYLYRHTHGVYSLNFTDDHNVVLSSKRVIKVTEAEAKEKYPNFKWVSLEELEND